MLAMTARMLCQLLVRAQVGAGRAGRLTGGVWGCVCSWAAAGTAGWKNISTVPLCHRAASWAASGSACRVRRSAPARLSASQYRMAATGRQGAPAHKAVHRDDGPGAGVTGQRQIAVRARQRFQLLHHAVGAGSVQPVLAAAGVEVGVLQQALGLGGELPGELAALVVAEHPPLAEQLEVQSSAAHRGVTHGGAVLPGHPPDFQVGVVAAEILQAHGGQKLRPRQTG